MRASHRRKNSMSQSLNLSGRRSPSLLDRSPSGRRSPNYLTQELPPSDTLLAPNTLGLHDDLRRSPSLRSPTGRRSPLRLSPSKELAIQSWNERNESKSPTSSTHLKSPVGFQSLGVGTTNFYLETRRSPNNQLPIPPITISNASDGCGLSPKSIESGRISPLRPHSPKSVSREDVSEKSDKSEKAEKKERTSVMKEILAFVRKPTKKNSPKQSPSKMSRFSSVFSKSSDNNHESNSPILRQSTYSSSPSTSSRAARNAVTKQMSCEGKFSSKLKSVGSKMSLRLRRATESKSKDKKSSGDDASDSDGSRRDSYNRSPFHKSFGGATSDGATSDPLFEPIHFDKVVQKRHEQSIVEESPSNDEAVNLGASTSKSKLDKPNLYEELKRSIETLFENKEPIYENIEEMKLRSQESNDDDRPPRLSMQCPKLEIEPPSRRPSFDPPRSPFLENFRSLSDTDHTSLGESFEVFESSNHHRESSFEDRHSSMDTSFDISRYHSTSYEDQTSSFEIVDSHFSDTQTPQPALSVLTEDVCKSSNIDLSSIEIVDSEKFQKKFPAGRKSSLETHFDYKSESGQKTTMFPIGMKAAHQASTSLQQPSNNMLCPRNKSPALSQQTSSNYSSRDSRDESSSFEHAVISRPPFVAIPRKYSHDNKILTDKRCASLLDSPHRRFDFPRRTSAPINTNQPLIRNTDNMSSGSEFEFTTPRRSLSASPKHTFTFRIVMKKVESSPEDLCSETRQGLRLHRERERLRRDSRRRKLKLDSENKVKSF